MRAIFLSYRREDAEGQAGRLFDDLIKCFGEQSVFMDVAGIEPGRDFRRVIDEHVASCAVLLAIIGKTWLDTKDEGGHRRLDDPMDFVRLETASALKRDIPLVPVLVQGAHMPRAEQLPPDLVDLAFRNAVELTHARWESDLQILIKTLERYVKPATTNTASTAASVQTLNSPEPARRKPSVLIGAVAASVLVVAGVGYLYTKGNEPPSSAPVQAPVEAVVPSSGSTSQEKSPTAAPTVVAGGLTWRIGKFPPPNAGEVAFAFTANGDPACASYNGGGCLWGVALKDIAFDKLQPLVCGEMHRARWGTTGYDDPKHWCALAKQMGQ